MRQVKSAAEMFALLLGGIAFAALIQISLVSKITYSLNLEGILIAVLVASPLLLFSHKLKKHH